MRYCYISCFWVIIALCLTSCRPEGDVVREDKDSFDAIEQAKIGQTFLTHIEVNPSEYNLLKLNRNPEIYNYLNTLLSTIVNTKTVQHRSEFNWEIFVVHDDKKMTTYTLPGGKIFITSEFLRFLTSEAQLLAILSHEMCYADQGVVMDLLQLNHSGLLLGDIIYNNPVSEIGEMIETLQKIPLKPHQVKAADLYAIEILCPFGYPPNGISTILKNITDADYPLEWEEIRPSYEDRPTYIEEMIAMSDCGEDTNTEETRYYENLLKYLD